MASLVVKMKMFATAVADLNFALTTSTCFFLFFLSLECGGWEAPFFPQTTADDKPPLAIRTPPDE